MRAYIHSIGRPGVLVVALAAPALAGCGRGGGGATSSNDIDVLAGNTVVVAIVNPVVNAPHSTGAPGELGDAREGIPVGAEPGGSDITKDGIAVVDVPEGSIDLSVDKAPLSLTVQAEGDIYDAPIAFNGSGAAFFADTPIRYAVGKDSGAFFFGTDDVLADIEAKLAEDNVVVVLGGGTYKGNLTIVGKGAVLFGEGFLERDVVIDGSITANGEAVRLRGLTITGDLAAKGNNFGVSFSVVHGTTSITGNAGAFVRNVFCGNTVVPSSNATLLDNYGVEPITALPADICN